MMRTWSFPSFSMIENDDRMIENDENVIQKHRKWWKDDAKHIEPM